MGCDIHIYRERFANGRWESVDNWTNEYGDGEDVSYPNQCYEGRNYDFFGLIAGVRREFSQSFSPRGMPLQCDERIARVADHGHSHSYLYLHELRELNAWAQTNTLPVSGMMNAAQWEKLKASIDAGQPDWNLLYPYCQATTSREYVDFHVEVPVSFNIGGSLEQIIESFDGIEGENHRVVFWFDN